MVRSIPKQPTMKKRVKFGVVQIREFERIAGDHPDAMDGPALGIGWRFVQKKPIRVNKHQQKQRKEEGTEYPSSSKLLLPLNAETRRFILFHTFDISKKDIAISERQAKKIRKQRKETYLEWQRELLSKSSNKSSTMTSKKQQFRAEQVLTKSKPRRSCGLNSFLKKQSSKSYQRVKSRLNDMKRSFLQTGINRRSVRPC